MHGIACIHGHWFVVGGLRAIPDRAMQKCEEEISIVFTTGPLASRQIVRCGDFYQWKGRSDAKVAYSILGLVRVNLGIVRESCLTEWSSEAEVLWEYFGYPGDAYTIKCLDFFEFAHPHNLGINPNESKSCQSRKHKL